MEPYSESTLRAMASDPDSALVERKESLQSGPKKIRQAVCAFANDLPGHRRPGVVFVGLRDDGKPAGLEVTDQLLTQLADIKTDGNIVPLPTLSVDRLRLPEGDVAVVTVHPSPSPPVRYRGVISIRTGPRRAIASAQDERILNERRRHGDAPFDVHAVPTASLADLDVKRFEDEYLPGAVERSVLEANDRSPIERLAATKMVTSVDDPTPTVLGVLVLGTRPQDFVPGAHVQFLRISGTLLSDPVVDETRCDGPVAQTRHRRLPQPQSGRSNARARMGAAIRRRDQHRPPRIAGQRTSRADVRRRRQLGALYVEGQVVNAATVPARRPTDSRTDSTQNLSRWQNRSP